MGYANFYYKPYMHSLYIQTTEAHILLSPARKRLTASPPESRQQTTPFFIASLQLLTKFRHVQDRKPIQIFFSIQQGPISST